MKDSWRSFDQITYLGGVVVGTKLLGVVESPIELFVFLKRNELMEPNLSTNFP